MSKDLKLRPLSEGIGLGTLRSPTSSRGQTLDINPHVMHHVAKEAYVPHSVGSHKRKQPKTRFAVVFVRAFTGWVLDVLMLLISITLCVMLGVIAWRFGAGEPDGLSPIGAVHVIRQFLGGHGLQ